MPNYPVLTGASRPQGINIHTLGRTSAALWSLRQNGIYGALDRDHHGFCQPQRYNAGNTSSIETYIDQMELVMPVRHIRPIWNLHSFDGAGAFSGIDAAFWDRLAERGWQFTLAMFDGPSQRYYSPARGMAHVTACWRRRHAWAWGRMLAHLDGRPALKAAIHGIEPLNEANSYNLIENTGVPIATAVHEMTEAFCAVWDLVGPALPEAVFYMGGWRYCASVGPFNRVAIPHYGGATAMEHIRARYPGREIVSSIHGESIGYTTPRAWAASYSTSDVERKSDILTYHEPVALTEVGGLRDNAVNMVPVVEPAQFQIGKNSDVWHYLGFRPWWWPFSDVARARLIDIGPTMPRYVYRHALSCATSIYAFPNDPMWFSGAQQGIKNAASPDTLHTDASLGIPAADVELGFGAGSPRPATNRLSRYFGGRGTCVIGLEPGQYNSAFGGDGWTVVHGTDTSSEIVYLGRGGGVVRTGARFNVVHTRWGTARVYAGPGHNVISCFTGVTPFAPVNALSHETTVILDPAGRHYIHDWHRCDHKISFMGAFASPAALRAACRYVAPTTEYWSNDLIVDLPGGGEARFTWGAEVMNRLVAHCRDFSEGWYGEGWSEPADYDPADLTAPITDPGFDTLYIWQDATSPLYRRDGEPWALTRRDGEPWAIQIGAAV